MYFNAFRILQMEKTNKKDAIILKIFKITLNLFTS